MLLYAKSEKNPIRTGLRLGWIGYAYYLFISVYDFEHADFSHRAINVSPPDSVKHCKDAIAVRYMSPAHSRLMRCCGTV
jgi:hypothetical protein